MLKIARRYTLVQDLRFALLDDPAFESAVQVQAITVAEAEQVQQQGGVLYHDWDSAAEGEQAFNEQPAPRGHFATLQSRFGTIPVFIPQ